MQETLASSISGKARIKKERTEPKLKGKLSRFLIIEPWGGDNPSALSTLLPPVITIPTIFIPLSAYVPYYTLAQLKNKKQKKHLIFTRMRLACVLAVGYLSTPLPISTYLSTYLAPHLIPPSRLFPIGPFRSSPSFFQSAMPHCSTSLHAS